VEEGRAACGWPKDEKWERVGRSPDFLWRRTLEVARHG